MPPTDVAIIGLACKFPGAAGPGPLWRLLREGRENTRFAGEAEQFDADFFNLSPREACAMDPRQRMALELTWELFEDAFAVPETLRGQPVSVYLGAMTDDYAALTLRDLADNLDHHSFTGISRAMIANRISYAFGLQGPSMTVDSGQSSSLVAVHLGCESVRTGRSPLAVAGGIHLNLADEIGMLEREFGAVSVSGHTYAFDRRADGYVRGEGAGLVLLKPLPAALEDGDRIHAVIRGGAVANAGHGGAGQAVPSARGEADVIRRALADAGLEPGDIDYIEAHGTGTRIGDAIEARALGEVFGGRSRAPLRVGSVKTNIGHAGGAAGVAGLLKAVLAIGHSAIPPSLNHTGADPDTDLNSLGLQVNTVLEPWPAADHPRRAGVSSFGMGGTNAHLIVEQPPARPAPPEAPTGPDPAVPWVLSARSARALINQAQRLSDHLAERGDLGPLDVAWSLVSTRTSFEHRAVVVGGDRGSLTTGLAAVAAGESRPGVAVGRATATGETAFVFPGQGSQWLGMGRQLHDRFDAFARAFDEAAAALDRHLRLSLRDVMWGSDPELLHSTEFAQPALFALGLGLVALWESFGVTPDLVMGHSVGEIAAACVAGVLSLPDAARLVAARGRLMAQLPAGGVMVAVGAGEDEVAPDLDGGVSIAAVNGPRSVVLSGERAPVGALADRLARTGRRVHRLAVSHAFHSPLMDPMLGEFAAAAAGIEPGRPRLALVSNVTGLLADAEYGSARYWVEHVRQPVRFFAGVRAAEEAGAAIFLELGPGAAMTAAVDQSLSNGRAMSLATMPKDRPEPESILGAAGQLFTRGVRLDWAGSFVGHSPRRVELPTYGFARERFWLGAEAGGSEDGTPAAAFTRSPDLAQRLHGLPRDEQRRALVDLVCEHAAAVLGHPGGHAVDHDRAFADLGFDSLVGVELRNRLTTHTGMALSRTLIFDYPTPAALAAYLRRQLLHEEQEESEDEKIWSALRKIPVRELRRTGLLDKLLLLAGMPQTPGADANEPGSGVADIDSLSPDDLIAMALNSAEDEDIE